MFGSLIILWLVDGKIKKEQVLHALVAVFVSVAFAEVLRRLFPIERPYLLTGGIPLTFTVPHNGAFPSSHTASAFALATTIWLHDRKVGWFYLVSALGVGIARILANVHYPVDILGGMVLGMLTAFVVEKIHFKKVFGK